MGLLDQVLQNVFEIITHPCKDERITLPHPTIRTKHKLLSFENHIKRKIYQLEGSS